MPTKEQLKELGDRIRKLRNRLGMTGDDLSARISCTTTYLYQIERGERPPSYKLLDRIAEELNVNVAHLWIGVPMEIDADRNPWIQLIVSNLPEDAPVTLAIDKTEIPVPHELLEQILKMIVRYKK